MSPLSRPVITEVFRDLSGSQFEFKLTGFTGQRFAIDTSPNLVDWTPKFTNFTANGFFRFSDSPAAGANEAFYRARLVP